jgi:cytochrome P450
VEADGERLTDEEMVNFSIVLMIAGHITITALLGNTVLCLGASRGVGAAAIFAARNVPVAVRRS